MFRVSLLLLSILLFLASPALAEEPGNSAHGTLVKHLLTKRVVGGSGTRPTTLDPVRSLHAAAFPVGDLGFWAQGTGVTLTRRSSLYDLEGGASWSLDDHVRLTASYRMLGIDLGYDADVEGADVEPGIQAPFLGVAFDF